jgi:hypothetical protein
MNMSKKIKTIKVVPVLSGDYRVLQVTNSLSYHVNRVYGMSEIQALCESPEWKVIIVRKS